MFSKVSIRKFVVLGILFLAYTMSGTCQTDTTVLSYNEFLENIILYHPIARKANLRERMAKAQTLGAKGFLDPKINASWSQKNFDDKLYYRQYQAKFKIPTILGIDVVGGYENTEGVFLNPENSTDRLGLWNVGVEVNILQGLIVNERRIAIDQAKVFQELAKNEQQLMLNDLLYEATSAYLLWQQYSFNNEVLQENLALARLYFQNTKLSYLGGEKTAIDTLEALILSQDAILLIQKNDQSLIKARQNLENYLWINNVPVSLEENIFPEDYLNPIFSNQPDLDRSVIADNPAIQAAINKLNYAEIEQRLKREKLKPKLKLKYNPLLATSDESIIPNYSINDYKWGFDFSMPLLFRSERAGIEMGEIKIQELTYELDNKRIELQNKIESSWLQQIALEEQLNLLRLNVENYRKLLEGENQKFIFGESSVFLLTKRQEKYITGQLKLIEVIIKRNIELLNYLYFSNQLLVE